MTRRFKSALLHGLAILTQLTVPLGGVGYSQPEQVEPEPTPMLRPKEDFQTTQSQINTAGPRVRFRVYYGQPYYYYRPYYYNSYYYYPYRPYYYQYEYYPYRRPHGYYYRW
ncbi:MAG: hypothetical protein ACKVOH_05020 [Chlamydiales bacterium]